MLYSSELQANKANLEKKVETLEVELAEKRLMYTTDSHMMHTSDGDDDDQGMIYSCL